MGSRMVVAYMVGFFLALGPFDHVIVSVLHLLFGMWIGAPGIGFADVGRDVALVTAGDLTGGLLLMTLTHAAQS